MRIGLLSRNRNFGFLWVGGGVSAAGSRASAMALPLLVFAIGGSAGDAGWVGFAAMVPYLLFQLAAGALVDRWNRRLVMIITDLLRFAAIGSVVAAVAFGRPTVIQLVIVAFAEGTLTVFHSLAEQAAVRHVVPDEQLTDAMALNETAVRGATMTGQPLGGLLFALGRSVPFLFDLATYVVSLAGVLSVRGRFKAEPEAGPQHLLTDIRQGIGWLWRQSFLRMAAFAVAASNLVFQALTLLVIVLVRQQSGSAAVGIVLGCASVGGILGSIAAPWFSRRFSLTMTLGGANLIWAALIPLIAIGDTIVTGATLALVGFVGPIWNIAVSAYQMKITPESMIARVSSAIGTLTFGAMSLGSLLAGYLLDHYSAGGTTAALTAIMAVVALAVLVAVTRSGFVEPADVPEPAGLARAE
jgi:MFS family permease